MIAEHHRLFIERFLKTGKRRLLNQKRSLFVKKSDGFVAPVYIYLFVNFTDYDHMILMFEPDNDLSYL